MNKLFHIQQMIGAAASGFINYADNKYWQEEKRLNRAEFDIFFKNVGEVTVADFNDLTHDDCTYLGFGIWSRDKPNFRLIPAYLYIFIPPGLELTSIRGQQVKYETYKDLSADQKMGMLAYGITIEPEDTFGFDRALTLLNEGLKLARKGWNGKDMYVVAQSVTANVEASKIWNVHNKAHAEKLGGSIDVAPYFTLKTAQDTLAMGWIPSTGDLFATDWFIVE